MLRKISPRVLLIRPPFWVSTSSIALDQIHQPLCQLQFIKGLGNGQTLSKSDTASTEKYSLPIKEGHIASVKFS